MKLKMKNKIILTLLAISIALNIFSLTACDAEVEAGSTRRMYYPDSNWSYPEGKLVVDRQTGVEYWYISTEGSVTLTLLVDSEGKPLIYKGE